MKILIPVILLSSMLSLPVFADGNDQHHDAKGSTSSAKQQDQVFDMDANMMKKQSQMMTQMHDMMIKMDKMMSEQNCAKMMEKNE